MEKDLLGRRGRREGFIQGQLRLAALLIDEFATDLVFSGERTDGFGLSQRLNRYLLSSFGAQGSGN